MLYLEVRVFMSTTPKRCAERRTLISVTRGRRRDNWSWGKKILCPTLNAKPGQTFIILLQEGADINTEDEERETALDRAVSSNGKAGARKPSRQRT
jgi:hypothetical protein